LTHDQWGAANYVENASGASSDCVELRLLLDDLQQEMFCWEAIDRLSRLPQAGLLPGAGDISIQGLAEAPDVESLLAFDPKAWRDELAQVQEHLEGFSPRVPAPLLEHAHASQSELRAAEAWS